jgi:hypothetical protein
MSEKDLDLKLATRRLYWSMGMTTRLNVKLSTHVSGAQSTRSKTEEYTDLDVLGIALAPSGHSIASIGDCKTVRKSANERCFWLRGVADFFDASTAYLVRSFEVPVSTRQLAERLRLGVLTLPDLEAMQKWYDHPIANELSILFTADAVQQHQRLLSNVDSKLNRLLDFRNLGYWIVEPHRAIDGVIHHLNQAANLLDVGNPAHVAIVLDMVWLFSLSLADATASIRDIHAGDIETALKQYLFGGPTGLRDKQNQAELIRKLTDMRGAKQEYLFDVLPGYYGDLLEVVTRHLRRPLALIPILRYAEWLCLAPARRELRGVPVSIAFGNEYDPIAGKLLADTIQFLVSSSRLPPAFAGLTHLAMPSSVEVHRTGPDDRTATQTLPSESSAARDGERLGSQVSERSNSGEHLPGIAP